ncbi:MAG TPA: SPW repeat protein [Thermomicrobiaceae bacterium]|nr:SPW repeat protein [Thermomicrobiaceae bacterium]
MNPRNTWSSRSGQNAAASGLTVIAGIWLIIAPFVLGYAPLRGSMWNAIVVGAIVAVLAAIRVWGPRATTWLSWIIIALGAWMIASPWIYHNTGSAAVFWDDIIVGAVIVVLGVWSAMATSGTAAEA